MLCWLSIEDVESLYKWWKFCDENEGKNDNVQLCFFQF